jgi:uncharacterized protein (TIGR02145 family)
MRKSIFTSIVIVVLASIVSCKNEKDILVKDIDGNVYKVVSIGNQRWMAQNLQTAHYNNGAPITEIEDSTAWNNAFYIAPQTAAYCCYNGNDSNNAVYGKLYTWFVVTDPRGVCPAGYHVPTDSDFIILSNYLGGDAFAGGHLKSTSSLWAYPNWLAYNSTGFSGLPGGYRGNFGGSHDIGTWGLFWSSTPAQNGNAWEHDLYYAGGVFGRDSTLQQFALSVRCVGN